MGPDAGAREVLFDGESRYLLVRSFDAGAVRDAASRRLAGHEARWALGRILGPGQGAEIVRAYGTLLRGPLQVADEADVRRMRAALLDAADRGHVLVFESRPTGRLVAIDPEDDAPTTPPPAPAREVTTWIAVVLMDDQDPPQPVAYAQYRIELPDGSTREGMLDGSGRARIEGIDPGTCQVSFPGYDRREWS